MKAKLCWKDKISWLIIVVHNCRTVTKLFGCYLKKNTFFFSSEKQQVINVLPTDKLQTQELWCLLAVTISVRIWLVFVFKLAGWEQLNKLILPCAESLGTPWPGCSVRRTHGANFGYKAVPKLRWAHIARNAVQNSSGIPEKQISSELAISHG